MYSNNQLRQIGRGSRTYSPEFNAQLVAACRILGMSVASVARNSKSIEGGDGAWPRESSSPHSGSGSGFRKAKAA